MTTEPCGAVDRPCAPEIIGSGVIGEHGPAESGLGAWVGGAGSRGEGSEVEGE